MKRILFWVCMVLFLGSLVSAEYAAGAAPFINNNDGTVTDTQTGLIWADRDNGSDIHWFNAKRYCEEYSRGGKSGWRMPTIDELRQLNNLFGYGSAIKKTGRDVWSSETRGSDAALFDFDFGTWSWENPSFGFNGRRALPVRSGK